VKTPLAGIGCVGEADSPSMSDRGTGRSSTSSSGRPVKPVQREIVAHLRQHGDRRLRLISINSGRDATSRVPQIVMDNLEEPLEVTG
jgi:hypothetical protein